jgi:calnexin
VSKQKFCAGDSGLVLKSKAKHAAVAAKFRKPFKFDNQPLIVQYEIAFQVSSALSV